MAARFTVFAFSACASALLHESIESNHASLTALETIIAANDTHDYSSSQGSDLTCMRWTGGTCWKFACDAARGETVCEEGKCMCHPGVCASARGACEQVKGSVKWIGSYTIRFKKPYNQEYPFIGVAAVPEKKHSTLTRTSSREPEWKIALTSEGRVRFESLTRPKAAMKLYNNRRRRSDFFLLERKSQGSKNDTGVAEAGEASMQKSKKHDASIPDNDDIWPIVVPIDDASPMDVTFQIRPTHQDGGGLEIWDPQTGHVLASANPEWWIKDEVASQGIAECATSWFAGCEGRQLVQFDPELPYEATPYVSRADIKEISTLNWWQTTLLIGSICLCCIMCQMMPLMISASSH